MIIKICTSCGKNAQHNELKKVPNEEQRYRCTYCGYPVTTNPGRREFGELIRKRQAIKAGRM